MFEDLLQKWDGEEVLVHHDAPTSTWMFICVHSTLLGPAAGGVRMKTYDTPAEGLQDGMRLAEGMTLKMAVGGLPCGGGKSVLAVPEIPTGEARQRIVTRFGRMVASLRGSYLTGPDMNTSEPDMDAIYEIGPYAFGRSLAGGGSGTSAPDTAVGVHLGIRASAAHAFGSPDLAGRSVLVQGLGGVGGPLVELLVKDGARVLVTDVVEDRVHDLVGRFGAEAVAADAVVGTDCDVYAPCAVGGVLSAETIPRLRCRVVAGAANNQLGVYEDAERLRAGGIVYAPDYVINAGGAFHLIGREMLGWSQDEVDRRVAGIAGTLTEIYERSASDGISTEQAAERIAAGRLSAARG